MPADGGPPRPARELAERLGLGFRDPALLDRALVHGSWLHEHPDGATGHNERLEFLGDAVVSLVVSEALHARRLADDEGVLSARRASIVSSIGLARLARRIELGDYLLLGEGEAQRGGRTRASLLASAFEALVGSVFEDQGWEAARDWLLGLAEPELSADASVGSLKSPKSRLQELTQRRTGERPEYVVLGASGPDHQKQFTVAVTIGGEVAGTGEGSSRRTAEAAAAAAALDSFAVRKTAGKPAGPEPAP